MSCQSKRLSSQGWSAFYRIWIGGKLIAAAALIAVCLTPTMGWSQLTSYSQDFETLDPAPGSFAGSSLSDDGWRIFTNVFNPSGVFLYAYGPFLAPNGPIPEGGFGPAYSQIVLGQGDAPQGEQQLVIFSDYNNVDHAIGNLIEANVFQEQIIAASNVGETWTFAFDAKRGDIAGDTTALAFIKTLNPLTGFSLTNFLTISTTSLPNEWARYSLSIDIDASLEGQILQIGFLSVATNYDPSRVLYDNITFDVDDGSREGAQRKRLVVNTTSDTDDGTCDDTHCSLREAINTANADPNKNRIHFRIKDNDPQAPCGPGSGTQNVCEIKLLSGLPVIDGGPVAIDGSMREKRHDVPGRPWRRPGIAIDGTDARFVHALEFRGGADRVTSGSSVRGLVISNFKTNSILGVINAGFGIIAYDSDHFHVMGNYIGTNHDGTEIRGTMANGVGVFDGSDHVRIGSRLPDDRNVLLSQANINFDPGNFVYEAGNAIITGILGLGEGRTANDHKVVGNYIGINALGDQVEAPRASWDDGIEVPYVSSGLINDAPLCPEGCEANDIEISRNELYNTGVRGIYPIMDTVDWPSVTSRNISIIGNSVTAGSGEGMTVWGSFEDVVIAGNSIVGNGRIGIKVDSFDARGTFIPGPTNVLIAGNYISGNEANVVLTGDDAVVTELAPTDITIVGNEIRDRVGTDSIGIDLMAVGRGEVLGDGVTPNDDMDADVDGANNLQNFPLLSSATVLTKGKDWWQGGRLVVEGSLNSEPNSRYRIDFYASDTSFELPGTVVDDQGTVASTFAEGERYLGYIEVLTGDDGNVQNGFVAVLKAPTPGSAITATATKVVDERPGKRLCRQLDCLLDKLGDTSEFSPAVIAD